MEENEIVYENVVLNEEQFAEILAVTEQTNVNIQTVNASIGHATMFLILLCIFQFYGLLSRARKKGGA